MKPQAPEMNKRDKQVLKFFSDLKLPAQERMNRQQRKNALQKFSKELVKWKQIKDRQLLTLGKMGLTSEEVVQAMSGKHSNEEANKIALDLVDINRSITTLAQNKASLLAKRDLNSMKN